MGSQILGGQVIVELHWEWGKQKKGRLGMQRKTERETHPSITLQRSTCVNISIDSNDHQTKVSRHVLLDFKFEDPLIF